MGNLSINQHYVPQRYLRYFAEKLVKRDKIVSRFSIFDKVKIEKRENQNIENYASERFFYDINFEALKKDADEEGLVIPEYDELIKKIDMQETEHAFALRAETTMFDPISQIVSLYIMSQKIAYPNLSVIPEDKKYVVAYYLALQYLRTKEFRERLLQISERSMTFFIKKALGRQVDSELLTELQLKLKENRIELFHNQIIFDENKVETISQVLLNHIWCIAVNETKNQFYTSDNPIVLYGHLGEHGLRSRGVEIIYPITPKLALVMKDREYFKDNLRYDNKFIEINDDYVKYCNELQVYQSYRYIFSKNNDFNVAENLLKQHPELSDTKRDRFLFN